MGARNTLADAISRLPMYGKCPFVPDLDDPCLSVAVAEGLANPTFESAGDDCEWIEDLEGIPTSDGQVTSPVYVAEEAADLEPISMEEYIETQAADARLRGASKGDLNATIVPWCALSRLTGAIRN